MIPSSARDIGAVETEGLGQFLNLSSLCLLAWIMGSIFFRNRSLAARLAYVRGHSVARIALPRADANLFFIESLSLSRTSKKRSSSSSSKAILSRRVVVDTGWRDSRDLYYHHHDDLPPSGRGTTTLRDTAVPHPRVA
ncbi:uncharacterized protein BDZ99DRAFT_481381 [Mytilinidion resinicola]|uniref:Uncharacterized protein n=1 Tax=Mytilinidion resinicola TaxID=574789 RepID=A0A6A6Y6I5_9PEZI|nr:uncharacterized protein BDZ99DRAFT_481381 [Mytilinidion resinicola]KAF2804219.1 hypothetical protein BDZ99DRAFT_481381 [Mytilinidion resinicola]